MNQQILTWLRLQPGWEESRLEHLGARPGDTALFPLGLQVQGRKTDILGTEHIRTQARFRLAAQGPVVPPELGALPRLGREQTAQLKDYRLHAKGKEGLGRYEGDLILTFWKE